MWKSQGRQKFVLTLMLTFSISNVVFKLADAHGQRLLSAFVPGCFEQAIVTCVGCIQLWLTEDPRGKLLRGKPITGQRIEGSGSSQCSRLMTSRPGSDPQTSDPPVPACQEHNARISTPHPGHPAMAASTESITREKLSEIS